MTVNGVNSKVHNTEYKAQSEAWHERAPLRSFL
jgi:hypothetical protein